MINVKIQNLSKVKKELNSIPPELMKKAQKEIDTTLIDIKEDAQNSAPVDTGYLREHVTVNVKKGQVSSEADYSEAVEFGTSTHMSQPFFFPAVERNLAELLRKLKNLRR